MSDDIEEYWFHWMKDYREEDPEPRGRKLRRRLRRIWEFLRYDVHQGVYALALFFPVIWKWRGWDFCYDFDVFMRAVELHRRNLIKHHTHAQWKRDLASMGLTLTRWRIYNETSDWKTEQRVWELMMDHVKRNAQSWWD